MAVLLAAAVVGASPMVARAVLPDEILADAQLEARARKISKGLRCVVCQNQSIDESNADLARDMRIQVRERIIVGDTDEEVVGFFVARYGDFVLLRPRLRPATLVLWIGPPIMALIGGAVIFIGVRAQQYRVSTEAQSPLSPADRRRLDALLRTQDVSKNDRKRS